MLFRRFRIYYKLYFNVIICRNLRGKCCTTFLSNLNNGNVKMIMLSNTNLLSIRYKRLSVSVLLRGRICYVFRKTRDSNWFLFLFRLYKLFMVWTVDWSQWLCSILNCTFLYFKRKLFQNFPVNLKKKCYGCYFTRFQALDLETAISHYTLKWYLRRDYKH